MASTQNQSANVDLFDAYFRRANLDRNGRISGNEAVAFFQGSGLPKQVLAQDCWIKSPNIFSSTGFRPMFITFICFRLISTFGIVILSCFFFYFCFPRHEDMIKFEQ